MIHFAVSGAPAAGEGDRSEAGTRRSEERSGLEAVSTGATSLPAAARGSFAASSISGLKPRAAGCRRTLRLSSNHHVVDQWIPCMLGSASPKSRIACRMKNGASSYF
jgi:hypothetical protein